MVRQVHEGVLRHRCFNKYPEDWKEDMMSFSYTRMLAGLLKYYDTSRHNAFGYVSHACFINYMSFCMKEYRHREREQPFEDT